MKVLSFRTIVLPSSSETFLDTFYYKTRKLMIFVSLNSPVEESIVFLSFCQCSNVRYGLGIWAFHRFQHTKNFHLYFTYTIERILLIYAKFMFYGLILFLRKSFSSSVFFFSRFRSSVPRNNSCRDSIYYQQKVQQASLQRT